jgi:hypothetical protein
LVVVVVPVLVMVSVVPVGSVETSVEVLPEVPVVEFEVWVSFVVVVPVGVVFPVLSLVWLGVVVSPVPVA